MTGDTYEFFQAVKKELGEKFSGKPEGTLTRQSKNVAETRALNALLDLAALAEITRDNNADFPLGEPSIQFKDKVRSRKETLAGEMDVTYNAATDTFSFKRNQNRVAVLATARNQAAEATAELWQYERRVLNVKAHDEHSGLANLLEDKNITLAVVDSEKRKTKAEEEKVAKAILDKGVQALHTGQVALRDGVTAATSETARIVAEGAEQAGEAFRKAAQGIETALRQQAAKELFDKGMRGLNAGVKGIVDGANMAMDSITQSAPVIVDGVQQGVTAVGDAAAYVAEAQRADYAAKAKEMLHRAILTKEQKLDLLAGMTQGASRESLAAAHAQKEISDQQVAEALSQLWAEEKLKNGGATPRANMLMTYVQQEADRPKTNDELMARYGSTVVENTVIKAPYAIKDPHNVEPGYVYAGNGPTPYAKIPGGRRKLEGDAFVTGFAKTGREVTIRNGQDKVYAYASDIVEGLESRYDRFIKTEGGKVVIMMSQEELKGARVNTKAEYEGFKGTYTEITMGNGAKITFNSDQKVSIAGFKSNGGNSYTFTRQIDARDLAELQQVEDTKRVAAATRAAGSGLKNVQSDGRNVAAPVASPPAAMVPPASGQEVPARP